MQSRDSQSPLIHQSEYPIKVTRRINSVDCESYVACVLLHVIAVADLDSKILDVYPPVQILSISCSFLRNQFVQDRMLPPPVGLTPLPWRNSVIHH